MKNKITIKERKQVPLKTILLPVIFTIFSLGAGFVITYWGKGSSYLELSLITALVTLFGFGLTSATFIHQALKGSETPLTKKLIHAIVNSLLLTIALIGASVLFDFLASLELSQVSNIIFGTIEYGALIYASICQVDILIAFIKIIKGHKSN